MSGGKSSQSGSAVQKQKITPQAQQALDLLFGKSAQLANTDPSALAPGLSPDTMAGIEQLRNGFTDNAGLAEVNKTVAGDYQNPYTTMNPYAGMTNTAAGVVNPLAGISNTGAGTMNPFAGLTNQAAQGTNPYAALLNPAAGVVNPLAGLSNANAGAINPYAFAGNDLSGVTDYITKAAKQAVGDRFSQAGRTGSPAEGMSLASTITQQLAPYAFGANESQLNRLANAGESAVGRQYGSTESQLAAQRAAGESATGRQANAYSDLISNLVGTQESSLGRQTSAEAQRLADLSASGQNAVNQGYGSEEARLASLRGAGQSATDAASAAEAQRLAQLYSGGESALSRGFSGYESQRAQQAQAASTLLGIPLQQAQNLLTAGQVQEQNQQQQGQAPYTQLQLILQPLMAALAGSPQTTVGNQSQSGWNLGFDANSGIMALLGL